MKRYEIRYNNVDDNGVTWNKPLKVVEANTSKDARKQFLASAWHLTGNDILLVREMKK